MQYYIENSERFLADEHLDIINPNQSGFITHQPLGPTLGKSVMIYLNSTITLFTFSCSDHAMELPFLASL